MSRRRPDGAEDANPLHRRLPAEVISRRRHVAVSGRAALAAVAEATAVAANAEEAARAPPVAVVATSLKEVLALKPEQRGRWLTKALQQAQDGHVDAKEFFDIVAHSKFPASVPEKAAKRMYRVLHANLKLFSAKQSRFLETDCKLALEYAKTAWDKPADEKDPEDDKQEAAATSLEDMMARCRDFVRGRQAERGERGGDGKPTGGKKLPAAIHGASKGAARRGAEAGSGRASDGETAVEKDALEKLARKRGRSEEKTPAEQPRSKGTPQQQQPRVLRKSGGSSASEGRRQSRSRSRRSGRRRSRSRSHSRSRSGKKRSRSRGRRQRAASSSSSPRRKRSRSGSQRKGARKRRRSSSSADTHTEAGKALREAETILRETTSDTSIHKRDKDKDKDKEKARDKDKDKDKAKDKDKEKQKDQGKERLQAKDDKGDREKTLDRHTGREKEKDQAKAREKDRHKDGGRAPKEAVGRKSRSKDRNDNAKQKDSKHPKKERRRGSSSS